jgi:hypothetical protein
MAGLVSGHDEDLWRKTSCEALTNHGGCTVECCFTIIEKTALPCQIRPLLMRYAEKCPSGA